MGEKKKKIVVNKLRCSEEGGIYMRTGAQPWYPRSNSFKKTKIYCDKLMVIQESISAENTKEKKKSYAKKKKKKE